MASSSNKFQQTQPASQILDNGLQPFLNLQIVLGWTRTLRNKNKMFNRNALYLFYVGIITKIRSLSHIRGNILYRFSYNYIIGNKKRFSFWSSDYFHILSNIFCLNENKSLSEEIYHYIYMWFSKIDNRI